jgi:ankyrin repeat protein
VFRGALELSSAETEAEVVVREKPGDTIGRYKLLEKIGEGGCGIVYLAEQTEPLRRRVALKVIKLGMDTKQVIARFEAERQALALMDHPNIAKVLDAGATDTGRPYFVMELVPGVKITDYCDQNSLSAKERLDLFMQVCHAIQHAHQKGIIHRDIKPSNILVAEQDGKPVPKVIDFGIAKATGEHLLTDKTLFTGFRQFLGTPAYMSPEQAGLGGADIDTRSDIYTLGVLLYELLTGQVPFEQKELLRAGFDEMRRLIREQEPPKPSTRLATALAAAPHSALRTPQLKDVRGDLDWIVMKCLEKDRARRYETASGLVQDIQRHLNAEPVQARAPGATYRIGKFIRRHRYGLGTASVILLLLITAVVVSTWQAALTTKADKRAKAARAEADQQRDKARQAQAAQEQLRRTYRLGEEAAKDPAEAVKRGDLERVRALIETNPGFVNSQDTNGRTPLFFAASAGRKDMAELLLANGADVNARSNYRHTPLHEAAFEGHPDVVKLLLARGADVDAKNRGDSTALHGAAQNGHKEAAELLVANKANVNTRDISGQTPLLLAVFSHNPGLVELLLTKGAEVNTKNNSGQSPLFSAASSGSRHVVMLLLTNGADVNTKESRGVTVLHYEALYGHRDVVEFLLAKGAEVNAKTDGAQTPLHFAAIHGNKDVVELLLAKGAEVNAKDNDGATPLHYASLKGYKDVVKLLREHGGQDFAAPPHHHLHQDS